MTAGDSLTISKSIDLAAQKLDQLMARIGQLSGLSAGLEKINQSLESAINSMTTSQQDVLDSIEKSSHTQVDSLANNVETGISRVKIFFDETEQALNKLANAEGFSQIRQDSLSLAEKLHSVSFELDRFKQINDLFSNAKQDFADFIAFAGQKKQQFVATVGELKGNFITFIGLFSNDLADRVDRSFGLVNQRVREFTANTASKFKETFPRLAKFPSALSDGMGKVGAVGSAAFEKLRGGVSALWGAFGRFKNSVSGAMALLENVSKIPGFEKLAKTHAELQRKINDATNKISAQLLSQFLPILNDLFDKIEVFLKENKETIDKVIIFLGEMFKTLATFLLKVLTAFMSLINGTAGFNEILIVVISSIAVLGKVLKTAFATNPLGLLLIAAIAIYAAFQDFFKFLDGEESSLAVIWQPMMDGWNWLMAKLKTVTDFISAMYQGVVTAVKIVVNAIIAFIQAYINNVIAIIRAIADGFIFVWQSIIKGAKFLFNWLAEKFTQLTELVKWVVDFVKQLFTQISAAITQAFSDAWQFILDSFDHVVGWFSEKIKQIIGFFQAIVDDVAEVFTSLKNLVNDYIDAIKAIFSQIPELISDAFDLAWEWVKEGFESVVNWINDKIDAVSGVFKKIGGFFGFGGDDDDVLDVNKTINHVSDSIGNAQGVAKQGAYNNSAKSLAVANNNHNEVTMHVSSDDPHAVARAVEQVMERRDRRTSENHISALGY